MFLLALKFGNNCAPFPLPLAGNIFMLIKSLACEAATLFGKQVEAGNVYSKGDASNRRLTSARLCLACQGMHMYVCACVCEPLSLAAFLEYARIEGTANKARLEGCCCCRALATHTNEPWLNCGACGVLAYAYLIGTRSGRVFYSISEGITSWFTHDLVSISLRLLSELQSNQLHKAYILKYYNNIIKNI